MGASGAGDPLLERALEELVGSAARVVERRAVGGGCIASASVVRLSGGERLFVKEHGRGAPGLLAREAEGLRALRSSDGPAVSSVLWVGEEGERQLLLLELIESAPPKSDFWERFGRALARLHHGKRERRFGFDCDNYIGATPQRNGWADGWAEFFAERRLRPQLELALERGRADRSLADGVEAVMRRLPELLPDARSSSLLHGDLWSGNFMVGSDGQAVIFDPAVSYGHREADLAMTELFGGFSPRFYAAYAHEWPLEPGYRERVELYNLYHLLNHLNLFGGSYEGSVRAIVERYR